MTRHHPIIPATSADLIDETPSHRQATCKPHLTDKVLRMSELRNLERTSTTDAAPCGFRQ
jgi:hypothetical protein